mgnify:CR=1 FL=1
MKLSAKLKRLVTHDYDGVPIVGLLVVAMNGKWVTTKEGWHVKIRTAVYSDGTDNPFLAFVECPEYSHSQLIQELIRERFPDLEISESKSGSSYRNASFRVSEIEE